MAGEMPKASPLESATELLARFQKTLAENRSGLPGIGKGTFTKLVKDILKDQSAVATPSDADLGAAFTLADEDKSGGVDEFEFAKIFNVIKAGKVKGLGAKPSMFEVNGTKKSREVAFKANMAGAAGVRARFQAKAQASGVTELAKPLFVALMKELLAERKAAEKVPTEADFAAAFTLADDNKNGVVDEEEFLVIYDMATAGKVAGLGSAHQGSAASRQQREEGFKKAFKGAGPVFAVGDLVTWTKHDEELVKGTVGKVLQIHGDGDVECLFPVPTGGPSKVFTFEATQVARHVLLRATPPEAAPGCTEVAPAPVAVQALIQDALSAPAAPQEPAAAESKQEALSAPVAPQEPAAAESKQEAASAATSSPPTEAQPAVTKTKRPWRPNLFQTALVVLAMLYASMLLATKFLSKPNGPSHNCEHVLQRGGAC